MLATPITQYTVPNIAISSFGDICDYLHVYNISITEIIDDQLLIL